MQIETIRGALPREAEDAAGVLRHELAELEAAYRREAEPILRRLAAIEALRPTHYYATGFPEDPAEQERD